MLKDLLNLANYSYSPFTWPPLIVGLTIALLGLYIVARERISKISLSYGILALASSVWLITSGIALCARRPEIALAWSQLENLGVLWLPSAMLVFTLLVINRWRSYSFLAWGSFCLSAFFTFQMFSQRTLLSGVRLYPWGYYHTYGPSGRFFLVFFACAMAFTASLLWVAYRQSPSRINQIRYKLLLQAVGMGFLGAVDFLPCFQFLVYPAGYLPVFTFYLLAAQIIVRSRFMEITPAFAAPDIIKTMPGILVVLDLDGRVCIANEMACEFLGTSESDIVGKSILELTSTRLPLQTFLKEGAVRELEIKVLHPHQGTRTISLSASIVRTDLGAPLAYVCAARDITDRYKTQHDLKLYADIVNNIQRAIIVLRLENPDDEHSLRIIDANPAASLVAGVSFQDLLGQTLYQNFPDLFKTPLVKAFAEVVRTGQKRDLGEIHYGDARVPENYFAVSAFPLPDQAVGVSFENVTARRLMEESLRQSELRFRRLMESNIIGFILTDFDGRMIEANDTFLKMLGYTREDMWAGRVGGAAMTAPEYRYMDQWMLERVKQTGACSPIEKEYIHKNGTRLPVLVGVVRLEETGEQCLCLVMDAAERRKALDELKKAYDEMEQRVNHRTSDLTKANEDLHREVAQREAAELRLMKTLADLGRSNKELEEFAYVVSHDLQEPLRKVASYTDLLSHRYRGKIDPGADKFINYIVDGTVRMRQMINDLLTYSRVGREALELQTVAFNEVAQEAIVNLEASIQENQAAIQVGMLPALKVNRSQMIQLFQNLIGNAVKFKSSDPPKVQVSAVKEKEHWRFCVQDNGIGIDPEYAERIFSIFQRLHTRQEYPGTGIGLAISKKVVERHGGRIWVEPAPEGGTRFCFTLPDSAATGPDAAQIQHAPPSIDLEVLP